MSKSRFLGLGPEIMMGKWAMGIAMGSRVDELNRGGGVAAVLFLDPQFY